MFSARKIKSDPGGLADQLRGETMLTPAVIRHVIADGCVRLPALASAGKTTKIDRLVEVGAWCDVAFALIEIELPAWSVRRLVCEDGEWLCSLTRQPNLPLALDDAADARHQILPLAILGAFLEAQQKVRSVRSANAPTVPQVQASFGYAICCDNFA
jgi:hypothetical protein